MSTLYPYLPFGYRVANLDTDTANTAGPRGTILSSMSSPYASPHSTPRRSRDDSLASSLSSVNGELSPLRPLTLSGTAPTRGRRLLAALLLVLFASTVSLTVLQKKVAIGATPYPLALSQLSPTVGFLCYGAFALLLWCAGLLGAESRAFPKHKAVVVGVLFSLKNILENLGNRGNVVPGPLVVIIAKLVVPLTLFMSRFPPISRHYTAMQYVGVLFPMGGIAASVLDPTQFSGGASSAGGGGNHSNSNGSSGSGGSSGGGRSGEGDGGSVEDTVLYIMLLLMAVIPLAVALLYLEYQLERKHPRLNVAYLWLWICAFEFVAGIPLAFLSAWVQGITIPYGIWPNFVEGLACVLQGRNITSTFPPLASPYTPPRRRLGLSPLALGGAAGGAAGSAGRSERRSEGGAAAGWTLPPITAPPVGVLGLCADVPLYYWLSVPAGLAFNLSMGEVTRRSGATLMWFVRALTLPVASLLFTSRAIMGDSATTLHAGEIIGIAVVFAALVLYNTTATCISSVFPCITCLPTCCGPQRRGSDVSALADFRRENKYSRSPCFCRGSCPLVRRRTVCRTSSWCSSCGANDDEGGADEAGGGASGSGASSSPALLSRRSYDDYRRSSYREA